MTPKAFSAAVDMSHHSSSPTTLYSEKYWRRHAALTVAPSESVGKAAVLLQCTFMDLPRLCQIDVAGSLMVLIGPGVLLKPLPALYAHLV